MPIGIPNRMLSTSLFSNSFAFFLASSKLVVIKQFKSLLLSILDIDSSTKSIGLIFFDFKSSFISYPLYLNTLTISLSPPTSWLHWFSIPVSEKPHLSMTLPDAGLPVKWSAQMFSKCFSWMQ